MSDQVSVTARIAVCQHPDGEGAWWPVSDDIDPTRCHICDCTPKVYVVAAEVERLREAAEDIEAALAAWRDHPTPPATDLRKLTEHIRAIDLPLAEAHDRLKVALNG